MDRETAAVLMGDVDASDDEDSAVDRFRWTRRVQRRRAVGPPPDLGEGDGAVMEVAVEEAR